MPLMDEQFTDAIAEAKHWFAAKKGFDKRMLLDLVPNQVEYDMPQDCDAILDVVLETSPWDISSVFYPNLFGGEQVPYSPFQGPGTTGLYSSFVQALQYTEQAKRVLGADPNWSYLPYEKKLVILPAHQYGSHAIVEYKSSTVVAIEQLPERDHDLVKRFAAAWAKRDLGNIYSRYTSWPTAEGPQPLNGPDLLKQAEAEFKQLESEIYGSAMPQPWVTG